MVYISIISTLMFHYISLYYIIPTVFWYIHHLNLGLCSKSSQQNVQIGISHLGHPNLNVLHSVFEMVLFSLGCDNLLFRRHSRQYEPLGLPKFFLIGEHILLFFVTGVPTAGLDCIPVVFPFLQKKHKPQAHGT